MHGVLTQEGFEKKKKKKRNSVAGKSIKIPKSCVLYHFLTKLKNNYNHKEVRKLSAQGRKRRE